MSHGQRFEDFTTRMKIALPIHLERTKMKVGRNKFVPGRNSVLSHSVGFLGSVLLSTVIQQDEYSNISKKDIEENS